MTGQPEKLTLAALERRAIELMQQGKERDALATWAQLAERQPTHAVALTQLGQAAFKSDDFVAARHWFEAAARADGSKPRQWINVALACQRLGDSATEETSLVQALERDPYDLLALILRGALQERLGRTHKAAADFAAALAVAPPADQLAPELHSALQHAFDFQQRHNQALAEFLDRSLSASLAKAELDGPTLDRFRHSLDILLGRKRRFESQALRYFYPRLPAIEFFERADFPWLDEMELHTAQIRNEFLAVHQAAAGGFAPYIEYRSDQPVAQWAQLNHNPDWSAFHLIRDGLPVPGNAERCPTTMAQLQKVPSPDQPCRTPVALFSALTPHTHIPAHVGASNCRLLVHLPLIVPPNCRFRVGSQVRTWTPGQALIFDDTIEHEVWNDSDQLRVVMIFDIWHPMLSEAERRMITLLNHVLNEFNQGAESGYGG